MLQLTEEEKRALRHQMAAGLSEISDGKDGMTILKAVYCEAFPDSNEREAEDTVECMIRIMREFKEHRYGNKISFAPETLFSSYSLEDQCRLMRFAVRSSKQLLNIKEAETKTSEENNTEEEKSRLCEELRHLVKAANYSEDMVDRIFADYENADFGQLQMQRDYYGDEFFDALCALNIYITAKNGHLSQVPNTVTPQQVAFEVSVQLALSELANAKKNNALEEEIKSIKKGIAGAIIATLISLAAMIGLFILAVADVPFLISLAATVGVNIAFCVAGMLGFVVNDGFVMLDVVKKNLKNSQKKVILSLEKSPENIFDAEPELLPADDLLSDFKEADENDEDDDYVVVTDELMSF